MNFGAVPAHVPGAQVSELPTCGGPEKVGAALFEGGVLKEAKYD